MIPTFEQNSDKTSAFYIYYYYVGRNRSLTFPSQKHFSAVYYVCSKGKEITKPNAVRLSYMEWVSVRGGWGNPLIFFQ